MGGVEKIKPHAIDSHALSETRVGRKHLLINFKTFAVV